MAFQPLPYQAQAISWLLERPHSGILLPPGAGKTACVLAARRLLKQQGLARGCLVLTNLRATELAWASEAAKWQADFQLSLRVAYGPRRLEALRAGVDLVVTNHDALVWLVKAIGPAELTARFDHLVVDESTRFKHVGTRRFKLLRPLLGAFERRTILTGTPAPNGLLDLFGQVFVVDQGHRLGKYITRYRLEYFYPTGYGGYTWLPQKDGAKRIRQRVQDALLWLDGADVGLPRRKDVELLVRLPAEARRHYDELRRELLLELEAGTVKALNAGSLSTKLRQLANGGLYVRQDGAKRATHLMHEAKAEAVEDLVDELSGDPLLVVFEFEHDKARLLKRLGPVPVVDGKTGLKESARLLREFADGQHPVLLGQVMAMAHGIDGLQRSCARVCWHSLMYDSELYIQLNRRVHRKGQQRPVMIYHVVAENTVDRHILAALHQKGLTERQLLLGLRQHLAA